MSQNSLLIVVALFGYLATAVLVHFGLLSGIDPNFVYGALTASLGVTGAVKVTNGAAVTLKAQNVVSQGSTTVSKNTVNDITTNG